MRHVILDLKKIGAQIRQLCHHHIDLHYVSVVIASDGGPDYHLSYVSLQLSL